MVLPHNNSNIWIYGSRLYLLRNGEEWSYLGRDQGPSTDTKGSLWVEGTLLCYIDDHGCKRILTTESYGETTAPGYYGAIDPDLWLWFASPEGVQTVKRATTHADHTDNSDYGGHNDRIHQPAHSDTKHTDVSSIHLDRPAMGYADTPHANSSHNDIEIPDTTMFTPLHLDRPAFGFDAISETEISESHQNYAAIAKPAIAIAPLSEDALVRNKIDLAEVKLSGLIQTHADRQVSEGAVAVAHIDVDAVSASTGGASMDPYDYPHTNEANFPHTNTVQYSQHVNYTDYYETIHNNCPHANMDQHLNAQYLDAPHINRDYGDRAAQSVHADRTHQNFGYVDANYVDEPHIDHGAVTRLHADRSYLDRAHQDRDAFARRYADTSHYDSSHGDRTALIADKRTEIVGWDRTTISDLAKTLSHLDAPHIDGDYVDRGYADRPTISAPAVIVDQVSANHADQSAIDVHGDLAYVDLPLIDEDHMNRPWFDITFSHWGVKTSPDRGSVHFDQTYWDLPAVGRSGAYAAAYSKAGVNWREMRSHADRAAASRSAYMRTYADAPHIDVAGINESAVNEATVNVAARTIGHADYPHDNVPYLNHTNSAHGDMMHLDRGIPHLDDWLDLPHMNHADTVTYGYTDYTDYAQPGKGNHADNPRFEGNR